MIALSGIAASVKGDLSGIAVSVGIVSSDIAASARRGSSAVDISGWEPV